MSDRKKGLLTREYAKLLKKAHKKKNFGTRSSIPPMLERLIEQYQPTSILDFGCGKGLLVKSLKSKYPNTTVIGYDPAFNSSIPESVDMIISTDVLEHVEPDQIIATLHDLRTRARLVQYHLIACHKAVKILADGRNAHLIIEPPEWWEDIIREAGYEILETATERRLSKTPFDNGNFVDVVKHEVIIRPAEADTDAPQSPRE